ncbi:hypothetical protein [Lacrimispora sp.]|nr:hypothetical protein [Lacrimispora sp.]
MSKGINKAIDILKERIEELNDEYLKTSNKDKRKELDIKIKEIWVPVDK